MTIIEEIAAERRRQIVEGVTPEHDDKHEFGDIALAAAAYCCAGTARGRQGDISVGRLGKQVYIRGGWFDIVLLLWPWETGWFKPTTPRRNLIKAAALIVAEIERLDRVRCERAAASTGAHGGDV